MTNQQPVNILHDNWLTFQMCLSSFWRTVVNVLLCCQPASSNSTSVGNLPHFPEWLSTTSRERAWPCHIQFWVCTVRVGEESGSDVERCVFPGKTVVLFPTCLKAAMHQGLLELLSFSFIMDFSLGLLMLVEKATKSLLWKHTEFTAAKVYCNYSGNSCVTVMGLGTYHTFSIQVPI